jgi:hypothetical protein
MDVITGALPLAAGWITGAAVLPAVGTTGAAALAAVCTTGAVVFAAVCTTGAAALAAVCTTGAAVLAAACTTGAADLTVVCTTGAVVLAAVWTTGAAVWTAVCADTALGAPTARAWAGDTSASTSTKAAPNLALKRDRYVGASCVHQDSPIYERHIPSPTLHKAKIFSRGSTVHSEGKALGL